jgi:hypothetical protein
MYLVGAPNLHLCVLNWRDFQSSPLELVRLSLQCFAGVCTYKVGYVMHVTRICSKSFIKHILYNALTPFYPSTNHDACPFVLHRMVCHPSLYVHVFRNELFMFARAWIAPLNPAAWALMPKTFKIPNL